MNALSSQPLFFADVDALRNWFDQNCESAIELWIGFYKRGTGRQSVTYPEAVDNALCYGWIDGIRRSVDSDSYTNRFTPRAPHSNWSRVNIKRAEELKKLGLMRPAGLKAFEAWVGERSDGYSFGQDELPSLTADQEQTFKVNAEA